MPSDKLRDDLPSYQESALGRFLVRLLVERARDRRAELERTPRRALRVNARTGPARRSQAAPASTQDQWSQIRAQAK